jgi:hypothetical protein
MNTLHALAVKSHKKEFYRILGAHHNDCFEDAGYYQVSTILLAGMDLNFSYA